jgi:hypothetical protein
MIQLTFYLCSITILSFFIYAVAKTNFNFLIIDIDIWKNYKNNIETIIHNNKNSLTEKLNHQSSIEVYQFNWIYIYTLIRQIKLFIFPIHIWWILCSTDFYVFLSKKIFFVCYLWKFDYCIYYYFFETK